MRQKRFDERPLLVLRMGERGGESSYKIRRLFTVLAQAVFQLCGAHCRVVSRNAKQPPRGEPCAQTTTKTSTHRLVLVCSFLHDCTRGGAPVLGLLLLLLLLLHFPCQGPDLRHSNTVDATAVSAVPFSLLWTLRWISSNGCFTSHLSVSAEAELWCILGIGRFIASAGRKDVGNPITTTPTKIEVQKRMRASHHLPRTFVQLLLC